MIENDVAAALRRKSADSAYGKDALLERAAAEIDWLVERIHELEQAGYHSMGSHLQVGMREPEPAAQAAQPKRRGRPPKGAK